MEALGKCDWLFPVLLPHPHLFAISTQSAIISNDNNNEEKLQVPKKQFCVSAYLWGGELNAIRCLEVEEVPALLVYPWAF
jgi:hypothetical protein